MKTSTLRNVTQVAVSVNRLGKVVVTRFSLEIVNRARGVLGEWQCVKRPHTSLASTCDPRWSGPAYIPGSSLDPPRALLIQWRRCGIVRCFNAVRSSPKSKHRLPSIEQSSQISPLYVTIIPNIDWHCDRFVPAGLFKISRVSASTRTQACHICGWDVRRTADEAFSWNLFTRFTGSQDRKCWHVCRSIHV